MAISYLTGGKSGDFNSTSKSTGSITVPSGATTMFAEIHSNNGDYVSTVKWNTTESFTQGVKIQNPGSEWVYLYYLQNPTATTSTVDVTASSNPGTGIILVTAYDGSGTPIQFSSTSYTGTSITETLTIAAGSWIIGGAGTQRLVSAGTGATLRQQDSAVSNLALGDSGSAPGAGSQSIQWTNSSTTQVGVWCELPIATAVAKVPSLTLLGVS